MDAVIETAKTIGITLAEIILVIYFCVKYINAALRKEDISKGVREQSNLDLQIIEKMDYYKELLNADRIWICIFTQAGIFQVSVCYIRTVLTWKIFWSACSTADNSVYSWNDYSSTAFKEYIQEQILSAEILRS